MHTYLSTGLIYTPEEHTEMGSQLQKEDLSLANYITSHIKMRTAHSKLSDRYQKLEFPKLVET